MVEINETERKKEKQIKRNEDNLRDLWDNVKCPNIRIIGIPNNACTLRITAAAGTKFAGAYSLGTVIIFPNKRSLRSEKCHPPRGVAASGFPPLSNIPYCCLPQESGPCLSSSVTDHPLRPVMRHSLGEPLPHQLADTIQSHPTPKKLSRLNLC